MGAISRASNAGGFPSALPFGLNHPSNMMSHCTFSSSLLWKLSSKCWKWVSDIWRSKDKRQETYSPCWPNKKLFYSDNLKFCKYRTQPGVRYKGRGLKWPQCLWGESGHAQRLKILHVNSPELLVIQRIRVLRGSSTGASFKGLLSSAGV